MKVKDKFTGKIETVSEISFNKSSYLVSQVKITNKGIDCENWFSDDKFKKRFDVIDNEDEELITHKEWLRHSK